MPLSIPSCSRLVVGYKRSSPPAEPSYRCCRSGLSNRPSRSAIPSSSEIIGTFDQLVQYAAISAGFNFLPLDFFEVVEFCFAVIKFRSGRIQRNKHIRTWFVASLFDGLQYSFNGFLVGLNVRAKPSSPTLVDNPLSWSTPSRCERFPPPCATHLKMYLRLPASP